ncbi:MAG: serine/threonine-protein kinase, partial [bacterium]
MANNRDELGRFGDYYLIDKIAIGGMAEIWRAKTIGLEGFERNVAIKCILPSYTQNPEFNSMFIDEARIASTLTHSNIVRITNFGVIENKYYHEMEFVDGRNLRQIFQKCKEEHVSFPIDSACYIISEVCKGLHYSHTKHDSVTNEPLNIIHRDISPQNMMISFEGEVKIIDWGIAKAKGKIEETRAGVLKGKFGYMSPEQAEGEELDLRTDIFSVGIVLYESVTGERLFIADSEINTLKKIKEGVIPLPSRVNPDVDKELEAIILKALARPRIERYQTCYDLYDDLVKYLHKKFPAYNSLKLSKFIKEIFSSEIIADRKRVHGREQSVPSYSPSNYSGMISGDKTRVSASSSGNNESGSEKSSFDYKGDVDRTILAESSSTPSPYIGGESEKDEKESTVTVASSDYRDENEQNDQIYFPKKKFLRPRTLLLIVLLATAIIYMLVGSKKEQTPPVKKQQTVSTTTTTTTTTT